VSTNCLPIFVQKVTRYHFEHIRMILCCPVLVASGKSVDSACTHAHSRTHTQTHTHKHTHIHTHICRSPWPCTWPRCLRCLRVLCATSGLPLLPYPSWLSPLAHYLWALGPQMLVGVWVWVFVLIWVWVCVQVWCGCGFGFGCGCEFRCALFIFCVLASNRVILYLFIASGSVYIYCMRFCVYLMRVLVCLFIYCV